MDKVGTLSVSAGSPQDPIVFAEERDDYGIWSSANLLITVSAPPPTLIVPFLSFVFAMFTWANRYVPDWISRHASASSSPDPQKPVALRLSSGATLENTASKSFSFGATAGGTVELYKECGDMASAGLAMASGKNATARFYHSGGTYVINGYAYMGYNTGSDSAVTYFEISGGSLGVNEDGDLVLSVVSDGTMLLFK